MFKNIFSTRIPLSPQDSLELARLQLENARNSKRPEVALSLCNVVKDLMSGIKKSIKRSKNPRDATDQSLWDEIAIIYFEHGNILDSFGHKSMAQVSYKKVVEWNGQIQEPNILIISTGAYTPHSSIKEKESIDNGSNTPRTLSPPLLGQLRPTTDNNILQIFSEDVRPTIRECKLPKIGDILRDTSQLTYCLCLLQSSDLSGETFQWAQRTIGDVGEHERLRSLATGVVRALNQDEIRNVDAVREAVFLSIVLPKDDFRNLMARLVDGLNTSVLLDFSLLDGLTRLMQGADRGFLIEDDLVKILKIISQRLQDTHDQSTENIYRLTQAASNVLDAMADCHVAGLDRETLHEGLLGYLRGLQSSDDPYLQYQAAYAFQALLCVPDNESPWDTALRRGGKVLSGIFGIVSAVKGLDVNGFIEGLGSIQEGAAGIGAFFFAAKDAFDGITSVVESGQTLGDSLKEGLRFDRKRQWYTALRGVDTFIQSGELTKLQVLICDAPCRLDPHFQWGICERLCTFAANSSWRSTVRCQAVVFLGEIYRNDAVWGQHVKVKHWILDLLTQLVSLKVYNQKVVIVASDLLKEFGTDMDAEKLALFENYKSKVSNNYSLNMVPTVNEKNPSPLLDRVQRRTDYMADLIRLQQTRLQDDESNSIYIPPLAKASLKSSDDPESLFPLMDKIDGFLNSDNKVFLLLGDSGTGKSAFNQVLERKLWKNFKKDQSPIPLYINLPGIERPEFDLVGKHLRNEDFSKAQIKEMKERELLLICDGYDECNQNSNLYRGNSFGRPGEWRVKMIISCRSENIGKDYLDNFQANDGNQRNSPKPLQEAVIVPFSETQIREYIDQYVSMDQRQWKSEDYYRAFKENPQLLGLVKVPFLLSMALEVLPSVVDMHPNLATVQVTRVALYDQFVELWISRARSRLRLKKLSEDENKAFRILTEDGFLQNGLKFIKDLSMYMFERQAGNTVVEYSRTRDTGSWKEIFFGDKDESRILREACPLARRGRLYGFIHKSMLEYGVARAIFDPEESVANVKQVSQSKRRGSVSSIESFESLSDSEEADVDNNKQLLLTPLARNYLVREPSILQFLEGRVQQEPIFKRQLLALIELSKSEKADKLVVRAAANAMTILVRAGVKFNGEDLQRIRIPGADLSGGEFDSSQLQGADLRKVKLRNIWLSKANLTGAKMKGVEFGEFPYIPYTSNEALLKHCAFSNNSKLLAICGASGFNDGELDVYSTSSWQRIISLAGSEGPVNGVAFSPNSDLLVSCGMKRMKVWDVLTWNCLKTLEGHSSHIERAVFSSDGSKVVSCSNDKTVRIWDLKSGECIRVLSGHSRRVAGIDISPDDTLISSASEDNTVRLWDARTGECLSIFDGHSDAVHCVKFLAEGSQIASGSDDKTIRVWDIENKTSKLVLNGHVDGIYCLEVVPGVNQLISGGSDNMLRVWDLDTEDCHQIFSGHTSWVFGVSYSKELGQIVSVSGDWTARLWGFQPGVPIQHSMISHHSDDVTDVYFLPGSKRVASICRDYAVDLWDFETGAFIKTFKGPKGYPIKILCYSNGDEVLCTKDDDYVLFWNIETGECIKSFDCDHNFESNFSHDNKKFARNNGNYGLVLWDVESNKHCHTYSGHGGQLIWGVDFSPSGDNIATVGGDGSVKVWDTITGQCRRELPVQKYKLGCVAYSTSSEQVASSGIDKIVRIWDVETGVCIHEMLGHDEEVMCVVYSPSGDQVASGGKDNTVRIWDVKSGQCLLVLQDFCGTVQKIAWHRTLEGTYMAVGSSDKSVRLWKLIVEDDRYRVQLCWSSSHDQLAIRDATLQDAEGLSPVYKQLLKQRGAIVK
ncbi:hypothetical protein BGZ76_010547 [Entomortierella beljakovae]|nr:hypothetical protein BGZ76_010547 [Entomortierella beljakovae]